MNYPVDCGTPTVGLTTVKLLLISIVSKHNEKFTTIDIKDFYLNTPLARRDYMRLKLINLPESVVHQYNIEVKATKDGYVHVEIKLGMYGLSQSGLIAHQLLEKLPNKKVYKQSDITPGFWTYDWRPICFLLCVNDFGVKYVGKQHAEHLMTVLRDHCKISSDWKGKRYLGMDLDWDYENCKVHLSMLGICRRSTHQIPAQTPTQAARSDIPAHQSKV